MSTLFNQLPLGIRLRDDATFINYFFDNSSASDNKPLLIDQLRRQLTGGERYLYLYGNQGCGRSHLLQAACHHASEHNLSSVYLPLLDCQPIAASELLNGLDQLSLVCLDDLQVIAGHQDWEEALFHLFNRLADNGVALLVSANCSVRGLKLGLADLNSRLSSGVIYHINAPNAAHQLDILQYRAKKRGLMLSDDVAHFIYYRCQRDMSTLMAVLDHLDKASLTAQRRLTIPFVKAVMAW